MKQYLLSVYHPETDPPEDIDAIRRDLDALNEELRAAGAWVFAGGLHPSSTATVVRLEGDEVMITDGPVRRGQGAHRRLLGDQGA